MSEKDNIIGFPPPKTDKKSAFNLNDVLEDSLKACVDTRILIRDICNGIQLWKSISSDHIELSFDLKSGGQLIYRFTDYGRLASILVKYGYYHNHQSALDALNGADDVL